MSIKYRTAKAHPVQFPATYRPGRQVNTGPGTTCNACQTKGLFWGWDPRISKPMLVDMYRFMHHCPTPKTDDIFPGWCDKCQAPELLWLRKQNEFELSEAYGLPHLCEQDPMLNIQDMSTGRCRFCGLKELLWVKRQAKFALMDYNGVRHDCGGYALMTTAWKEAKRMNYAFEKSWLKNIPDGTACKKCKGKKHIRYFSKAKRVMMRYNTTEPVEMTRACLHCKCIGSFTKEAKAFYLKSLRNKYWPFRGGVHKWKKYDSNGL